MDSEGWIDACLKGLSLACRRLQVAQQSFENRAAELQQSMTVEMKIASVEARAGLAQAEAVESRRLAIVKGNMHGSPFIVKTFGHGKGGRGVFFLIFQSVILENVDEHAQFFFFFEWAL